MKFMYYTLVTTAVCRNMFLNWIGKPSIYLPCCMVVWGLISVLTGITHE